MARASCLLLASLAVESALAQPQQGARKFEAPKWLPDEGKDLWNDIEGEDDHFSEFSCEAREKLLKLAAGKGDQEGSNVRSRILLGLGICELKKSDFVKSKKRFESCISEMNVPSEDVMLQNQGIAHIALAKQATVHLSKHEVTQAATALRRGREILNRNVKQVLKQVHKQMGEQQDQLPPVEMFYEEASGFGKTGQFLPSIMMQVPVLKQEFGFAEVLESTLTNLDRQLAGVDTSLKSKRLRLEVSKGKKDGSLFYAPALSIIDAVIPAERSSAAQELLNDGAIKNFLKEAASAEKSATFIKRSKEDKGCKKGFEKTCEALTKVADLASNGFGDTRMVIVKEGKPSQLDSCTTNANIGILVAAKDGASLTLSGVAEPVPLESGKPVVIDFCREGSIEASSTVPVLFAQAWHPEFAGLERTTELRARAKAFGLSEDEQKAAVKVVNDFAKKKWEKSSALWRKDSEGHESIKKAFGQAEAAKKSADEAAADEKRKEEEAGDEERKKNLEALEKKREAKRLKNAEAEEKRKKRAKQLEEERAARDPWLNDPSVTAVEKKIEELKEARRDANAKLEFDLSTQLTKDISAEERKYKKAVKAAKKAHKKGMKAGGGAAAASDSSADKEDSAEEGSELAALKAQLADVSKRKAAAAEAENFGEAKKLKSEAQELEKKIKKLEL